MTTQDAVPDLSDANLDEIVDCFDDCEPWQRQAKKCIAALRAQIADQAQQIAQQARDIARLQVALDDALGFEKIFHERAEHAEAERDALRADAERYRFWRQQAAEYSSTYDCRFPLKLSGTSLSLSFRPARPDVEVSPDYEKLVDAAIDAARQAAGEKV